MARPRGRECAAAYVRAFVERQLNSGFVRGALLATDQTDVSAPRWDQAQKPNSTNAATPSPTAIEHPPSDSAARP